ncbi:MAG TPA: TIGR00282 family metallophosphoesterase [Eubacteriaceae bacterium]|nr:TIGR00282 family metallophosphoesterase [Eubacteriaceae bacterium]
MRLLIIGDIVGRPGRTVLKENLDDLIDEYESDIVIANGENASAGLGITEKNAEELFDLGISVITTGNHVWDKKETLDFIDEYPYLLRPANYPDPCPGNGSVIISKNCFSIAVINLSGRSYMKNFDCPFKKLDQILEELPREVNGIILDFHGETTSEKLAMGYYAQDRLSLVYGTHTHVQTADHRILNGHTGYITDIGMTGPYEGIIGVDKDIIIQQFLNQRPAKYKLAEGAVQINGISVDLDEGGACRSINPFIKIYD